MNSIDSATVALNGEALSAHTPLRQSVKKALESYLQQLEDLSPVNLYELVLAEMEAPLLEVVMRLTKKNQSKAATLLGLSRGTLRKKLKQYHLEG